MVRGHLAGSDEPDCTSFLELFIMVPIIKGNISSSGEVYSKPIYRSLYGHPQAARNWMRTERIRMDTETFQHKRVASKSISH